MNDKLASRLAIENSLMKEMEKSLNDMLENNQEIFLIRVLKERSVESINRIFNSVE